MSLDPQKPTPKSPTISFRDCLRRFATAQSCVNACYSHTRPPEHLGIIEQQLFRMRGLEPGPIDMELCLDQDGSFGTKWNAARRAAAAEQLDKLRIAVSGAGELRPGPLAGAAHCSNLDLATRMLDGVARGLRGRPTKGTRE